MEPGAGTAGKVDDHAMFHEDAMDEYWICRRDNPHFRLTQDGAGFSTSAPPLAFATHDLAFDYMTRENTRPPLEGVSLEIVKAETGQPS